MSAMQLIRKKQLIKLFLLTLLLLGLFVLSVQRASAAAPGVDTEQPASSLSNGLRLSVSAVGTWYNPRSISTLYVPTGAANGSVTISDIYNQINGGGRISYFAIRQLNQGSGTCGAAIIERFGPIDNSTAAGTRTITFTNNGAVSNINRAYRPYCVDVRTDTSMNTGSCSTPPGCYSMNLIFRLTTPNLLGNYSGVEAQGVGTGYFQEFSYVSANRKWTIDLDFAPSCTESVLNKPIEIYDLDTTTAGGSVIGVNSGIRIQLFEADKGATNWSALALTISSPGGFDPYPGPSYFPRVATGGTVSARPSSNYGQEKKYRFRITGIGENNKIRILTAYEQLAALDSCPPPTPGALTCTITSITYPSPSVARVNVSLTTETGVPSGSTSAGLHIGVSSVGDPSTWASSGVPSPAPDFQSNYIGRNSGLSGLTHYTEDAGGFTYNRYYINSVHAAGSFDVSFDVNTNNTSSDIVVRLLKRSNPANWHQSYCQSPVNDPAPTLSVTCTNTSINGFINASVSFSATVTITGSSAGYTLKGHHRIDSGAYTVWGNIAGSTFSGSETFSTTGTRTIRIEVGMFNPSTAASPTAGTTATCDISVTIHDSPECNTPGSFSVWAGQVFEPGQDFRSFVTVKNNASVTLDVTRVRYTINAPAPRDRIAYDDSGSPAAANVAANSIRTYHYGVDGAGSAFYERITTPGSYTITWDIDSAAGKVRSGGSDCTTTVNVNALPTCTARMWYEDQAGTSWPNPAPANGWYGRGVDTDVVISSGHDTFSAALSSAEYDYVAGNGLRNAMQLNGSAAYSGTVTSETVLDASGMEFDAPGNVNIWLPKTYTDQIKWEVDWGVAANSAGSIDRTYSGSSVPSYRTLSFSETAECESDIVINIAALTCTATTPTFNVGVAGRANLPVNNDNLAPPTTAPNDFSNYQIKLTGVDWSDTDSHSGLIQKAIPPAPLTYQDVTSGNPLVIPGGSSANIYTQEITYGATGVYPVTWNLSAVVGIIGDANNSVAMPINGAGCTSENAVSRRPYVRFYGNDIIAGASMQDVNVDTSVCTTHSDVDIRSVSGFTGSDSTNGFYQGSAAELAAIATGSIENVLPGIGSYRSSVNATPPPASFSQPSTPLESGTAGTNITTNISFLAFAGGGTGVDNVGGDYQSGGLCNAIYPDVSDWSTTGSIIAGSNYKDINRNFGTGNQTLSGGTVPIKVRTAIYVDGDVTITNNITYDTSTSWATAEDVPLFRVYATGDIRISGNVSQLEGLYVAGGTIYTCSEFQESTNAATIATVIGACGNNAGSKRLTLIGAFVADAIEFGRTGGDVSASNTAGDEGGFSGGNKAERLHFFPELYIALWDIKLKDVDGKAGNAGGKFNFISSPPPVF